ncbi:hypothetical protein K466DRAFT_570731 [Polyporus arcularius HHB13444]|uniref:Uncharacterized protein n=1 Tax=Polyporus arcularius HHB13444 TaxID=1314778 RepID=A0A5C3NLL5_9APHY|nr:hypothetical protein K466DRAFT_570731 [Polyporus arcularius HHB13444]
MVPPTLEGSGYLQEEITGQSRDITTINTSLFDYEAKRPVDIKLSTLRDTCLSGNERAALDLLTQKRRLVVDDRFRISSNHKDLSWTQEEIFIDLLVKLGRHLGLDVVLPNMRITTVTNIHYSNFTHSYPDVEDDAAFRLSTDIISPYAPMGALCTIACQHAISALAGTRLLLSLTWWDRPEIQLPISQLDAINTAFKTMWHNWLAKAPDSYQVPIFDNAVPQGMVIKYGQNRCIWSPEDLDGENSYWSHSFDLKKIFRITVAFAAHYAYTFCTKTDSWYHKPSVALLGEFGTYEVLYKFADQSGRSFTTPAELDDFPLFNKLDEEVPVYCSEGRCVPRREPTDGGDACGLLANLRETQSLFARTPEVPIGYDFDGEYEEEHGLGAGIDDGDEAEADMAHAARWRVNADVKYNSYPHGFTRDIGQWQANGVIAPMENIVRKVNQNTRADRGTQPMVMRDLYSKRRDGT